MKKSILTIGLVYDKSDEYVHVPKWSDDQFAEFEPESTIQAMEMAIKKAGFLSKRLEGPLKIIKTKPNVDVIWNIGEGWGTRNREAWAPVLCEMYQIPCLGSDAHTLSISLDKHLSKQIASCLGISVAKWELGRWQGREIPQVDFFPAVIKPRYEGTAKGISRTSVVKNNTELHAELKRQWKLYHQDLIIEQLLTGPEYTVALSGNPLKPHTVLERAIDSQTRLGIHVLEQKGIEVNRYELTHEVVDSRENEIKNWAEILCKELNIRDFVRFDFKCDENGKPFFLELNPLPTFSTNNTFAILAELDGIEYTEWLSKIVKASVDRVLGLQNYE